MTFFIPVWGGRELESEFVEGLDPFCSSTGKKEEGREEKRRYRSFYKSWGGK